MHGRACSGGRGWTSADHHSPPSPLNPESQDQLGDRPQGQGYWEFRPGNFPSSPSLGIGTCHKGSGKYFTKQWRHVPQSPVLRNSMKIPWEALLPVRWLRKVGFDAAGALGTRGDSQNPGDCTGDAGKVPPVACNVPWPWGLPGRKAGWLYSRSPKAWDLQKGIPQDHTERAPALPARFSGLLNDT